MKSKKTNSKVNQIHSYSESKREKHVDSQKLSKKKVNHNNFRRTLEAYSDCV